MLEVLNWQFPLLRGAGILHEVRVVRIAGVCLKLVMKEQRQIASLLLKNKMTIDK